MYRMYPQLIVLLVTFVCTHGDQIQDSLKSWKNVTRFDIQKSGKSGVMATMETDDFKQGVVEFKLHQRSTLHGNHLEPSVKDCLYEGFVMHESEVDVNSPVRLKHCSDATGNVLELSGLIILKQKVFTLHMNEDGSTILFSNDDVRNDVLKTKTCDAIEKGSLEKGNSTNDLSKKINKKNLHERHRRQTSYQQHERTFVEVLFVASNEYYQLHGSSQQTVSSSQQFQTPETLWCFVKH